MPYAIGRPVRDLKGSWLFGVKARKLTKEELQKNLFLQDSIKIFDDLEAAQFYASRFRKKYRFPKNTLDKSTVTPVFTVEVNNNISLYIKNKELIETEDNIIPLEYFDCPKEVISKIIRVDFFDSKITSMEWESEYASNCILI
ncbi:hypothetical protein DGG96_19485 [Legionella qingyii]|uniref:Uncharacterized protein n=1 Tax=Legionella qingyii TaxID=2184757 RepID=A0A317TX20_9GAMM|nr:hypothetical protein [Legionella qingyii]PWY53963.1 hypothetical protein DGG96_19485 [Legionella qingyii]RUR18927.1 hypothetical protein ELY20_16250 [Legionella qingyii]RUR21891.1 hypothetical protein ELY16_15680 [Legionella qingyii]